MVVFTILKVLTQINYKSIDNKKKPLKIFLEVNFYQTTKSFIKNVICLYLQHFKNQLILKMLKSFNVN